MRFKQKNITTFFEDILPETITSYDMDDSDSFKSIAVFDCRGYMPVEFEFLVNNFQVNRC